MKYIRFLILIFTPKKLGADLFCDTPTVDGRIGLFFQLEWSIIICIHEINKTRGGLHKVWFRKILIYISQQKLTLKFLLHNGFTNN